jgi:hypothetical protein
MTAKSMVPMLGAVFAHVSPPDASGKKRNVKPKAKGARGQKVTKGEKSVVQPAQQHGELATGMAPKPLSDRHLEKESAKSSMRRATSNWVDGHISSKEHAAIHARAKHVLAGKHRR